MVRRLSDGQIGVEQNVPGFYESTVVRRREWLWIGGRRRYRKSFITRGRRRSTLFIFSYVHPPQSQPGAPCGASAGPDLHARLIRPDAIDRDRPPRHHTVVHELLISGHEAIEGLFSLPRGHGERADPLLLAQRLALARRPAPSTVGAVGPVFEHLPDVFGLPAGTFFQRGVAEPVDRQTQRILNRRLLEVVETALPACTWVEPRHLGKGELLEDLEKPVRLLEQRQDIGFAGECGCLRPVEDRPDMVSQGGQTWLGARPIGQVERLGAHHLAGPKR